MSESTPPSGARHLSTSDASHPRQSSCGGHEHVYTCECCPKKPKRFASAAALRSHEAEKQYTCQYCPNRFKNKNEAERHQNSLHLRTHSWSCAALAGAQAAFFPSAADDTSDLCGYCGEAFPNTPAADWDSRAHHLGRTHKFRECNPGRKFFRADHFRQHLKHSHGGLSGKWTNSLEIACMQEEPLPEPRGAAANGAATTIALASARTGAPALMITTSGLSPPTSPRSGWRGAA